MVYWLSDAGSCVRRGRGRQATGCQVACRWLQVLWAKALVAVGRNTVGREAGAMHMGESKGGDLRLRGAMGGQGTTMDIVGGRSCRRSVGHEREATDGAEEAVTQGRLEHVLITCCESCTEL